MTTAAENELLTRTGRGTPMGDLMRQYWIPACLSSELKPGAPPIRLMLLGEKLIAFRETSGRIGIMDHRCPHRATSLFFGRAEGDGIRCIYHGWKFDASGQCTDQPNLPPEERFCEKVSALAYKVREQGGLVWTYMGARAEAPPFPDVEGFALAESEREIRMHQRECNWLQALEGDIDTSHFSFLHMGTIKAEQVPTDVIHRFNLVDRAPRYHVKDTDWGTMYAAWRPAETNSLYYRFSHFIFPFYTLPPDGSFSDLVQVGIWVPMDDTHCMVFTIFWRKRTPGMRVLRDGSPIPGCMPPGEYLPDDGSWFGRGRLAVGPHNDYLIDRDAQASDGIFSGIASLVGQDQAVTESMGDIVDRTFERLAPSDRMITRTRRRLLNVVRAFKDEGVVPPGVDLPHFCEGARAGCFLAPVGQDWHEAYLENLVRIVRPISTVRVAAE
jgi:phthalate 4,5-dioxygenase oxygenase subunit